MMTLEVEAMNKWNDPSLYTTIKMGIISKINPIAISNRYWGKRVKTLSITKDCYSIRYYVEYDYLLAPLYEKWLPVGTILCEMWLNVNTILFGTIRFNEKVELSNCVDTISEW